MENSESNTLTEIQDRLDHHISSFSKKISRDKSKAYYFKLTTITLTFLATLALGVEGLEDEQVELKNFAFFCTAAVTFVTGIDLFYNHKGLWVQYTKTRNVLYQIKDDLNFLVSAKGASEVSVDELAEFHKRIQACLNECNEWWVKERQNAKA